MSCVSRVPIPYHIESGPVLHRIECGSIDVLPAEMQRNNVQRIDCNHPIPTADHEEGGRQRF